MIPELNEAEWYHQRVRVIVDRISLLNLVGMLELSLRQPAVPQSVKIKGVELGKAFISSLLDDGLILPDEVRESWELTFKIDIKRDPDQIIPGLTDQEGRPWK